MKFKYDDPTPAFKTVESEYGFIYAYEVVTSWVDGPIKVQCENNVKYHQDNLGKLILVLQNSQLSIPREKSAYHWETNITNQGQAVQLAISAQKQVANCYYKLISSTANKELREISYSALSNSCKMVAELILYINKKLEIDPFPGANI